MNQIECLHFPEKEIEAPKVNSKYFPYVKYERTFNSVGANSVIIPSREVRYFRIDCHKGKTNGVNCIIEKLEQLENTGVKFLGYGCIDPSNAEYMEAVKWLHKRHDFIVIREKLEEEKVEREAKAEAERKAKAKAEREALIADLKAEIKAEMLEEKKAGRPKKDA